MAQSPYSGVPTVNDTTGGLPRQNIQSSPADFGGLIGQSEQVLGRDISTASRDIFQSAIAQQEMYNKASVQQATNAALDIGTDKLYDPDKGYLSTRGAAAMSGFHPTMDAIKGQFQGIRDGLANDAQRIAFDQESRRYLYYYEREAGAHADQQAKQFYGEQDTATQFNAVQTGAMAWNNPDIAALNLERGRASIMQTAQRDGYSPEKTEFAFRNFESTFALRQLQAQAITDPAGALDKYNNGFLPGRPQPDPDHPGQLINKPVPLKDLININPQGDSFIHGLMEHGKDAMFHSWLLQQMGQPSGVQPGGKKGTPFVPQNLPQGVSLTEDAIVRTVAGEASGQPLAGQRGVAAVIMNRANGSGMSPRDVVFAPNQFEPWNGGAARVYMETMDPNSREYQDILNNVVRPIMSGSASDPTGGATHFYAPAAQEALGRSAPSWATGAPVVIGGHNFYKVGYGPGAAPPPDERASATLGRTLSNAFGMGHVATSQEEAAAMAQPAASRSKTVTVPQSGVVPPPDFEEQRSPAEAAMPDESLIVQNAIKAFPDSEDQKKVISMIRNQFAILNAANYTARVDLMNSVKDQMASAVQGNDINYSEAHIRHLLPPAQAAQVLEELSISQTAGAAFKSIQWGTPEDVMAARARLSAGLPPNTRYRVTKEGHVELTNPNDQSVVGYAPPEEPADENTGSAQFRYRQRLAAMFDQQMYQRDHILSTNPMAYVQQNPLVRGRYDAAIAAAEAAKGVNDPNDPRFIASQKANNAFFDQARTIQTQLGVPAPFQRIMTAENAQAQAMRLKTADPTTTDVGQVLEGMRKMYGDNWHQAFGDMVTLGQLPKDYQVLAMTPGASDRFDLQEMMKFVNESKKGIEGLHSLAGEANMKLIDSYLASDGSLDNFFKSVKIPGLSGNADGAIMMQETAKNLAAWYMYGDHTMTANAAVTKATNAIIGNKYDFDGPLRVPKGQLRPIENYAASVMSQVPQMDIQGAPQATANVPGILEEGNTISSTIEHDIATHQITANERAQVMRSARWITNESDSGAILTAENNDHVPYVVKRTDGSRVEFNWKDAIKPNATGFPMRPMQETAPALQFTPL